MPVARVSFRDRDRCRILLEGLEMAAEIAGAVWYRGETVAVGDWVEVRVLNPSEALVEAVLPRRTQFSRRAAGRREDEQIVAANIDVVFLVMGLDHDFNLRRLERYLTLAWESGAEPVVVLNKADLCPELAQRRAAVESVARGAAVVTASASTGDVAGILAHLAPGRTVALLGSSGVGKSTILNAVLGEERQRVREVREDDSHGRHTTTFRELVPLPGGGALIDTPGMRELQLWAGEESLRRAFDEVADLARDCRFADCRHSGELGCAVAAALDAGTLDPARWQSYRKLQGEIRRHDARAQRELKQDCKRMNRAMREHYKLKNRMP